MENLILEGSDTLPTIEMLSEGKVKIEGRALPEDAVRFFKPVLQWIDQFSGSLISVDINLEYYNTSVSKQIHDFFNILNRKPEATSINITWHYEEGDDEMLESGEIYAELFPRFSFAYNRYEEVVE
ncbi:MAG: DUF1987 domain-containing protein [Bacteroidales bacterium]|nr:DUF1987 domain-containing protein [Bacteroidales bacterium]